MPAETSTPYRSGELGRSEALRLDSLTGLRAAAALAVFIHHVTRFFDGQAGAFARFIGDPGTAGVTFFFVLSGFVLTWSRRDGDTAASFYRRRAARIVPAYYVAMVGGVVATIAAFGALPNPPRFIVTGLFAQSWIPQQSWYFAINPPLWSLSCEAFFYLVFPLYATRLLSSSLATRRTLQLACFTSIVLLAVISEFVSTGWTTAVLLHGPPVRMLEFVFGASVAVDVARGTAPRVSWSLVLLLAVGAYLLAGISPGYTGSVAIVLVPFSLLIAVAAQRDISGRGTAFSGRRLVWLGTVSYCFYLVHALPVEFVKSAPAGFVSQTAAALACLALALLLAAGLHYGVERPWERRLRGTSRTAPPVTV